MIRVLIEIIISHYLYSKEMSPLHNAVRTNQPKFVNILLTFFQILLKILINGIKMDALSYIMPYKMVMHVYSPYLSIHLFRHFLAKISLNSLL